MTTLETRRSTLSLLFTREGVRVLGLTFAVAAAFMGPTLVGVILQ